MGGPEDLTVGLEIPVWEREGTFDHWNRFAAVNADFAGHHMDDEVGRREGFDAAFIMAPLSHSYVHSMLREWLGDDHRIVQVDLRLRSPLLRGRTLRAGGTVTGIRREGVETLVDLDIWQVDDRSTSLGVGTARVALFS